MKEAILYQKLKDDNVKCLACQHYCLIKAEKHGICGVRKNIDGTLITLNYGETVAASIDPIEKKPLYHFLPESQIYSFAASGCNLHCAWCQNWQISQTPRLIKPINGKEISPKEHVRLAKKYNCPAIAYTYSEPTIFVEYAFETMVLAHQEDLKNVWVSNGFMSNELLDLIIPYLDAANIDYKGSDEVYQKYCGGKAKAIENNLIRLYKSGIHLEITSLIIPNINDTKDQIENIAKFITNELSTDIPWHISRFFPGGQMHDHPITPIETLTLAKDIGKKAGLKHVYLGNV